MRHSMFTQNLKNSLSKLKNQSSLFNNESGVGLIELLVSILILSGVVAAMLVASHTLPGTSNQINARVVLQQEASLSMEEMSAAIRECSSAALDVNEANDVLTVDSVIYSANNGLLGKTVSGSTQILLGDYTFEEFGMAVTDLQLVDNYPGENTITITLGVALTQTVLDAGGTITNTVDTLIFSTRVYPRNRS